MSAQYDEVIQYTFRGNILKSSPVGCKVSGMFRETLFRPKSVQKPPKGHASLEVFLKRREVSPQKAIFLLKNGKPSEV